MNNIISEMVALSSDDIYERYNYFTTIKNRIETLMKAAEEIGEQNISANLLHKY